MKGSYSIKKPEQEWEGLTLDEIRYARALTETRIMISREIVGARFRSTLSGNATGTGGRSLMSRMLGALSWLDYGLLALRIGAKAAGIFRHRK